MSRDGTIDKRQHRRLTARIPVRFGTEGRMCEGMIIDISEGGVQIRPTETFAVGVVVDVFVQFPRRRLRLRTRVAWVRDEPPTMGLSFIQRDRSLMAAYDQWVEETRGQAGAGPEDEAAAGGPGGSPAPPAPPSAPVAEPSKPVVRHVETARGHEYDIRMEKGGAGWRLLVHASPRPSPDADPEIDRTFADFAAADAALREFLRDR